MCLPCSRFAAVDPAASGTAVVADVVVAVLDAASSLYTAREALRLVSVLLQPVLPERMGELWRRLGWQPPARLGDTLSWCGLQLGASVVLGLPLFPRDISANAL